MLITIKQWQSKLMVLRKIKSYKLTKIFNCPTNLCNKRLPKEPETVSQEPLLTQNALLVSRVLSASHATQELSSITLATEYVSPAITNLLILTTIVLHNTATTVLTNVQKVLKMLASTLSVLIRWIYKQNERVALWLHL